MEKSSAPLVIWRFVDGKPGHMQQSLGLVQALARRMPVEVLEFDVQAQPVGFVDWVAGRFPAGLAKRRPQLLVGAGHATHWALLAARRAVGGRAVVLMKPSLPPFLFDLVVAPEHDGLRANARVLVTQGVLNPMRPGRKVAGSVLVLLGGDSKHAAWDERAVREQVDAVVAMAASDGHSCVIADSRRTPPGFSAQLAERYGSAFQPWADCPRGWLAEKLAVTATVWVSEDSASMVYEALSAGCRVGILRLPAADRSSRVLAGVERLAASGAVMRFGDWYERGGALPDNERALAEADRVAAALLPLLGRTGGA